MELNQWDEIADLIVKYIRKELTARDYEQLECWRKESPRHEEEFRRLCLEQFLEEQRRRELLFSVSAAKERFRTAGRKAASRRLLCFWTGIAAAMLLIFGGGWLLFRGEPVSPTTGERIVCGSSMARLTLGNGEVIELKENTERTISRQGVDLKIEDNRLQYVTKDGSADMEYNTLEIPRRGEYKLTLSDGTRVWLNSETQLRYPQTFAEEDRHVYLSGEAYFEVARDTLKPFIVHLDHQEEIKVLGTSFNVHAYPDGEKVYTTLVEGHVNVKSGNSEVDLFRGEQALCNRVSRHLEKRTVDVRPYTAWKDGRFVFRKERLEDIMKTVARWYDVDIIYENDRVKNLVFSGNVERYEDFDKIIAMLAMIRMVDFRVEENRIFVNEIK